MLQATPIIASLVVLVHCAILFWPRKPLKTPTDENGLPILWRNETGDAGERKDVACVWRTDAEHAVVGHDDHPTRKSA